MVSYNLAVSMFHIQEMLSPNLCLKTDFLMDVLDFPQSFMANTGIKPYIKSSPLPSISLPIHYSLLKILLHNP
jgi:hypothetical protein